MNSLLEFTELLKNRLTDLLLIEADNDKHVFFVSCRWILDSI